MAAPEERRLQGQMSGPGLSCAGLFHWRSQMAMAARLSWIPVLLVFLFLPSIAGAFNNQRKGFLIGATFGGAGQHLSVPNGTSDRSNLDGGALATSARIGWGFGDRTELYAFNSGLTSVHFYFIPIPYATSITGIGARYYVSSKPSFFLGAGGGVATLALFEGAGGAGLGTFGWEFAPHWDVELEVSRAQMNVGEPYENQGSIDGTGVALKFAGTIY